MTEDDESPVRPTGLLIVVALIALYALINLALAGFIWVRFQRIAYTAPILAFAFSTIFAAYGLWALHEWMRRLTIAGCAALILASLYELLRSVVDHRLRPYSVGQGFFFCICLVVCGLVFEYLRRPDVKALFGVPPQLPHL